MPDKPQQLSRESLGNRVFKYMAGVSLEADGTFELIVAAASRQAEHLMPEPSPARRPFRAADLNALGAQLDTFLRSWQESQPASRNQVLCCTKVVENAIARARTKLNELGRGATGRPSGAHGR